MCSAYEVSKLTADILSNEARKKTSAAAGILQVLSSAVGSTLAPIITARL